MSNASSTARAEIGWICKMRPEHLRALILSILALGLPSIGHAQVRPAVAIILTGDDGLTQGLQRALEKQLLQSNELRLVRAENEAQFVIRTPSNVTPDELGNRQVLVYRALLAERGVVLVDRVGVCYQSDQGKCARDIVRGFSKVIRDYARRPH